MRSCSTTCASIWEVTTDILVSNFCTTLETKGSAICDNLAPSKNSPSDSWNMDNFLLCHWHRNFHGLLDLLMPQICLQLQLQEKDIHSQNKRNHVYIYIYMNKKTSLPLMPRPLQTDFFPPTIPHHSAPDPVLSDDFGNMNHLLLSHWYRYFHCLNRTLCSATGGKMHWNLHCLFHTTMLHSGPRYLRWNSTWCANRTLSTRSEDSSGI